MRIQYLHTKSSRQFVRSGAPVIAPLRAFALVLMLLASSLLYSSASAQDVTYEPVIGGRVAGFWQVASTGFGDRQNSWPWSMQWWNGYLYVATNRAWNCAETYSLSKGFPLVIKYPPDDPDVECPENPYEMPLGAEIWRFSPVTKIWQRVYSSPKDVHMPGTVGYTVARDVGFRGMVLFTEPDGTEALYVGGVSSRFLWDSTPPPRILRSTDGLHFAPVPQEPGTFLHDLVDISLRNPVVYKDKLYFISGTVQGSGSLIGAADPAAGNDAFQIVSPPATIVSAAAVYNGYLYIGVQDIARGYSILKTDASGPPPYQYTQIVSSGGYLSRRSNHEVLSMEEFGGRLYIGGNGIRGSLFTGLGGPAELIRINPDDSWDLIVGDERETPTGWKFPISSFMAGFGNFYNGHIWRMATFENQIFVGTFDASTAQKDDPDRGPALEPVMGFDLYRSENGRDFIPVTRTGFDDKFNFGVRSLEATPWGLYLGTANYYYGLQIWYLNNTNSLEGGRVFLPLINSGAGPASASAVATVAASIYSGDIPERVEALVDGSGTVVAWNAVPGAQRYQVWRSTPLTTVVDDEMVTAGWGNAELAGETQELYWRDTASGGSNALYYVVSVGASDSTSGPSNLAVSRPASAKALLAELDAMHWGNPDEAGWSGVKQAIERAAAGEDLDEAMQGVTNLLQQIAASDQAWLPDWQVQDATYVLQQLQRRIALAEAGTVSFRIE